VRKTNVLRERRCFVHDDEQSTHSVVKCVLQVPMWKPRHMKFVHIIGPERLRQGKQCTALLRDGPAVHRSHRKPCTLDDSLVQVNHIAHLLGGLARQRAGHPHHAGPREVREEGDGRWWREARSEIDGASCLARRRHMMWGAPCMLIGRRTTLAWLRRRRHREGVRRPALCRPAVPLEVDRYLARRQRLSQLHAAAGVVHEPGGCYSGRASTRSGLERPYWRTACSGIMPLGARMGRISARDGRLRGAAGWSRACWRRAMELPTPLCPCPPALSRAQAMSLSADRRPSHGGAAASQSTPAAHSCRVRRSRSST
jgi:hypothetical protein